MTNPRTARPRNVRRAAALLFMLGTGACARTAPLEPIAPPAAPDFVRVADSIIDTPPMHRAFLGIEVYDPVAKKVLYSHNGERHFVPASNEKLWATTTALEVLGPNYRYRTPILGVGLDAGTGTASALVVVGRGDPTFSERFHVPDPVVIGPSGDTVRTRPDPAVSQRRSLAVLDSLADSVVASGVKHVAGDLIVDASFFDDAIIPGAWTFGNLNGTSAPPTGAFVVSEGVMRVQVAPGAAIGEPAVVTPWTPAGYVPIASRVVTGEAVIPTPGEERGGGRGGRVSTQRGPWSDTLKLAGTIAIGAQPQVLSLPMTDPVVFAANALADAFRSRGIVIDGSVRVVRDSVEAAAVRAGRLSATTAPLPVSEVAAWSSPPMSDIVRNILQPSQNWIAEQLLRTLGGEKRGSGSFRNGIEVEMEFLEGTVGIDSLALSLNDGSGMSPQNLVTPHAIVQLLDYARTAPWSQTFRDALTGPGRPGTLQNRLPHLAGRLTGKTGTLNSVNALSGYLTIKDGRELIFSTISNASGLGGGAPVEALNKLVDTLANGIPPR